MTEKNRTMTDVCCDLSTITDTLRTLGKVAFITGDRAIPSDPTEYELEPRPDETLLMLSDVLLNISRRIERLTRELEKMPDTAKTTD